MSNPETMSAGDQETRLVIDSETLIMGIPISQWKMIADCILECTAVTEILIYGSRAKGTYRQFSDIDITNGRRKSEA